MVFLGQVFLGALGMWVIAYANPELKLLGGGVVFFLVAVHCNTNSVLHLSLFTTCFNILTVLS